MSARAQITFKQLLKLPTTHERKSRKSRYREYTSNALEVANSLLLVSCNTKVINFYQANTVLFVLRLGRNHCYRRKICYPRSGQRKFRLRRSYPTDYNSRVSNLAIFKIFKQLLYGNRKFQKLPRAFRSLYRHCFKMSI